MVMMWPSLNMEINMQFKSKNLLLTLSTILGLGLLTAADCGGGNDGSSSSSSTSGTNPPKDVYIHEWVQAKSLANLLGSTNDVKLIALDKGGKFLYATNNSNRLSVIDISPGIDKIAENASWKGFADLNPGLTGTAGKLAAAFNGAAAARIVRFAPTKGGVLVSVDAGAVGNSNGGAGLLIGKDWKAAWQADHTGATHLYAQTDATSRALYAGVLSKADGNEYVYVHVFSTTNTPNANSTFATAIDAAGTSVAAKLGVSLTAATAFDTTEAAPFYVNAGGKALVVSLRGISVITDGNIGAVTAVPNPAALPSDANVGRWQLAAGGTPPTSVVDVAVLSNKVYIALNSGVFVFDASAVNPQNGNIDVSWPAVSNIKKLAVDEDGKKIYAVLADGLYECTDGKKAGSALAAGKVKPAKFDYDTLNSKDVFDDGSKFPSTAVIEDAKFVSGHLIIATSNEGLVVRKKAKVQTINK